MHISKEALGELLEIHAAKEDGKLLPTEVVEYARENRRSALHREFDKQDLWNDKAAAKVAREQFARRIIQVYVKVPPRDPRVITGTVRMRAFLSPPSNRISGGGYEKTEDVLNDPTKRVEMIENCFTLVLSPKKQFSCFPELAPFFDRLEELVKKFKEELGNTGELA